MKPDTLRQQKIADVYDADIWPLIPERAAQSILRHLPRLEGGQVLDAGTASGKLALAVAERLDDGGRVLGVDSSPALIELAQAAKARHPAGAKVHFQVADTIPAAGAERPASAEIAGEIVGYDLVISNLGLAEAADPEVAIAALAGALKPGGRLLLTFPLRGSWSEFLDLYLDVLTEQGRREGLAALRAYRANMPDAEGAMKWLEAAGLKDLAVDVDRWELLFKSAREFFFAPVIEMGPLSRWKQIAGGRGDEMQDVFFFVKEAIETYFSGTVFPVTIVTGCLRGTKPLTSGSPAPGAAKQ